MRIAIPNKKARGPKQKRAKLPPPSKLLFGHAVVDGKVALAISTKSGTVEAHAVNHKVLKAHFDAARAMRKWPVNAEVSEEAFLAAVKAAGEVRVGGFPEGRIQRAAKPKASPKILIPDAPKPPEDEAPPAEPEVK